MADNSQQGALGPDLAHRYRIVRSIGAGGMAEVLLARQRGLEGFEKLVVIKRILPHLVADGDFEQMFLDEARTAADLRHHNIVQVYDVGHDGESYYIAMEYLHGVDVRELTRTLHARGERLPIAHALQIAIDAATGLHYAHTKVDLEGRELEIVHRDVSPHNLIVTFDGVTKLVDFGIARAATRTKREESGSSLMGKCSYLSPEQAIGERLDGRSDQFALGIVLFEMLTGQRLFAGRNNLATVHAVIQCEIPDLHALVPDLPEELAAIVYRALARRAHDRYRDCRAFGDALEGFLAGASLAFSHRRVGEYLTTCFPAEAADDTGTVTRQQVLPSVDLPAVRAPRRRQRFGVLAADERASSGAHQAQRREGTLTAGRAPNGDVARAHTVAAPAGATPSKRRTRASQALGASATGGERASSDGASGELPLARRVTELESSTEVGLAPPVALAAEHTQTRQRLVQQHNLPATRPIIGRARELAALGGLLDDPGGPPLVTILGTGGMGKTRVSIELARQQLERVGEHGGAWFIDLSEANDLGGVLAAVGATLGVRMVGGASSDDIIEQLGAAIAARGPTVLLFDNVEQVVAACSEVLAYCVARAPEARFIATSRERLDLAGERVFDLEPLVLPRSDELVDVMASPAVQLFISRARLVRPRYSLGDDDESAMASQGQAAEVGRVARIVRELDGIPLAIELCAARLRVLSTAQVEKHLAQRFELLRSSTRDVTPRQATLRGAIDWSYRLLSQWERAALQQVSVFRGGFTLEAADAVVDLSAMRAPWTLDALHALRDKSLIWTYDDGDSLYLRFGFYVAIREFAEGELAEEPSAQRAVHARHAAYYLDLGRTLSAGVESHGGAQKLELLAAERDNLLAVFERALAAREAAPALEAVLALDGLLALRGPFAEHRDLLDRALAEAERAVEQLRPALLARAYAARGRVHHARGDAVACARDFDSTLAHATAAGDKALAGQARAYLAAIDWMRGDVAGAQKRFEHALGLIRQAGDRHTEGRAIWAMGMLAQDLGQLEAARQSYLAALAIHREVGNRPAEGVTTTILANLYLEMGYLEDARRTFLQAREILDEVGDRRFSAIADGGRAVLAQEEGAFARAAELYQRSISVLGQAGDRQFCGCFWGYYGTLAHERGRPAEAARRYREALSLLRAASDRRREGAFLAALGGAQAQLGELEQAEGSLDQAREILTSVGDTLGLPAVDIFRGLLALARGDREGPRALLDEVQGDGTTPPSDDLRIALRVLRRALSQR